MAHILILILSTVAYRLSPFHPLWRFPGPLLSTVTNLWRAHLVWKGKRYAVVKSLHEHYGPIVRTGPNTLSINSHAAITPIYANANAFGKSDAYTMRTTTAGKGLFFMTDLRAQHLRRRLWAPGFSASAFVPAPFLILLLTITQAEPLQGCSRASHHSARGLHIVRA